MKKEKKNLVIFYIINMEYNIMQNYLLSFFEMKKNIYYILIRI